LSASDSRGLTPIGASAWIWRSPVTDAELEWLVPHVASLGFDSIELPVEEVGGWDPARTASLLAEHGLGATVCCVMPPGRDLTDPACAPATAAYLRECVSAAAAVGSPVVSGPMYAPVGKLWRLSATERSATLAAVAEALRPVAEHAESVGVSLGVEPLNRFETSLVNTAEQAMQLVGLVDSPACGLLLDSFHLNIEERDPAAAIRSVGSGLVHFHACANDRGAPGADHLPWHEMAAALPAQVPVAIESFTADNEAIAAAARVWRPLAESPDALARDGLAFLRGLLGRERATAPG
jgi:D-psicose/D-tagatose/L-ribulose 3-epimerase